MSRTRERLPRIRSGVERRKVTICMSADMDLRLTVWAKRRGISRSDLVELLLEQALAGVEIVIDGKPVGQSASAA